MIEFVIIDSQFMSYLGTGTQQTIRSCGGIEATNFCKRETTRKSKIEYNTCECDTDLCNSSITLFSKTSLIISISLVSILRLAL